MRIVNTTTHSLVISAHDDTPHSARHKCGPCHSKLRFLSDFIVLDGHWLRLPFFGDRWENYHLCHRNHLNLYTLPPSWWFHTSLVLEIDFKKTSLIDFRKITIISGARNSSFFRIENISFAQKNWKGRKDDGFTEPIDFFFFSICTRLDSRELKISIAIYAKSDFQIFVWLPNLARHEVCFAEFTIRWLFRNWSNLHYVVALCVINSVFFSIQMKYTSL